MKEAAIMLKKKRYCVRLNITVFLITCMAILFLVPCSAAAGKNLVRNPSSEDVVGDKLAFNGAIQFNAQRFTLDFFPVLMLLVGLGIKKIPERVWKSVILFSILQNALALLLVN